MRGRGNRGRLRVGVSLGSGSARGFAHIGVLRALAAAGIEPDVVCGTSIGALVGAAYVTGQLDALEAWVRSIKRLDILRLIDPSLARGGFLGGVKVFDQLRNPESDTSIERLPKPFAAVATELDSGREVWLREGSLLDAVRASISVPGLFAPVKLGDAWLVDGGLVNPVPVSLCRALGADLVIAVDLNADVRTRLPGPDADDSADDTADAIAAKAAVEEASSAPVRAAPQSAVEAEAEEAPVKLAARIAALFQGTASALGSAFAGEKEKAPGFFEVLAGSINIMQDRINRSRMAGDPPDVLVTPLLAHIRLLDFDRAAEAIDAGVRALEPALPTLARLLGRREAAE
jgi:NTE family protein